MLAGHLSDGRNLNYPRDTCLCCKLYTVAISLGKPVMLSNENSGTQNKLFMRKALGFDKFPIPAVETSVLAPE